MLPDVGPVQILDLPHKWSDHAALFVSIGNVEPPPPHEAVPESSKKMRQFTRQKQRSIATMFATRVSSPKANKTVLSELAASQPVASADSAIGDGGQQGPVGVSQSSLVKSQGADTSPGAKRQRLEASDSGVCDRSGPGEVRVSNEKYRADPSSHDESLQMQSGAQLPVKEKKAMAGNAIKSSAEEAKREAGQQNIRAFFTQTAQKRRKD